MPPRYITGNNYEIQVRNCFPSMLNAIDNFSIDKTATLTGNDIPGVKCLEFKIFDSHIETVQIDYTNTYRLNGRYALTVSGEYSNNSFTVLLMITDRRYDRRFGVEIKTTANRSFKKIVANIPLFGVQCIINYNPDTNYYVFSLRSPLTKADLSREKEVAGGAKTTVVNDRALVCLHADFLREKISFYKEHENGKYYEYKNLDDDVPYTPFSYEDMTANYNNFSDYQNNYTTSTNNDGRKSNIWEDAKEALKKGFGFFKNTIKNIEIDQKHNIQFDLSFIDDFMQSFTTKVSSSNTTSLTYKNVGNIEGLDLYCRHGVGIFGQSNTSFGASYCRPMGKYFDLSLSGECSDGSITVDLMVVHRYTGISFGVEMCLTGKFKELQLPGIYIVVNVPLGNMQFVFKCDIKNIANFRAYIRPTQKDNDSNNKPNDDDSNDDDDSKPDGTDDGLKPKNDKDHDPDKSDAATMGCDLIYIEADFVNAEMVQNVYKYETIKKYARMENVASKRLNICVNASRVYSRQEIPIEHIYEPSLDAVPIFNRPQRIDQNFYDFNDISQETERNFFHMSERTEPNLISVELSHNNLNDTHENISHQSIPNIGTNPFSPLKSLATGGLNVIGGILRAVTAINWKFPGFTAVPQSGEELRRTNSARLC